MNGSRIEIEGEIKFNSDKPAVCFTLNYKAEDKVATDYYFCKTCNIKWVCTSCAQACHESKGHMTELFLENNVPEWACCYCPKKKKCCIPNAKKPHG